MRAGSARLLPVSLALIIVLGTVLASSRARGQSNVQVKAFINVEESGNATVTLVFKSQGEASLSFTLPKFEKYTVCNSYGNFQVKDLPSYAYFYYNSTIVLTPGANGTSMLYICYNFPYASLLSGNQGWFMSPMLVSSPPVQVEVYVRIPNVEVITLEFPRVLSLDRSGYRVYLLTPGERQLIPGRVVIEYKTTKQVQTVNFTKIRLAKFTIESPIYYRSLSERILEIAARAYERLQAISGVSMDHVHFKLYLPMERLGGISALGFVMGEDINAGGRGPIMLNLALIRYAPGYLETTVIHEMIHSFLGRAGVEANDQTRWFHEGLAQYISILVAQEIGINVSDYAGELYNASTALYKYVSGNFSFIQSWPSDPNLISSAYLASFYIVNNISSTFDGEEFIRSLFNAIKSYGKVRTSDDIVNVVNMAAGRNLAPLFRAWGFTGVRDWHGQADSPTTPPGNSAQRQAKFSVVVLFIGILIALITYTLNNRVQRELEVARSRSVFREKESDLALLDFCHVNY
ncbi:hypothetical protein IG193_06905 [Infirmifilum lucidum]|uniref:Peptidase M1 membrane alanine aminopeptidase domain-containing protein n=1 Tax=Infirmifilum lucidum TaxID=2776706 RepID=A0A7L9FFL5_9CREN|nr:hypothetical protein [Infirmifilum lucidum]QOJ78477.1 hypothetical protein IG193_06905 [Infirmifilum lucidum]